MQGPCVTSLHDTLPHTMTPILPLLLALALALTIGCADRPPTATPSAIPLSTPTMTPSVTETPSPTLTPSAFSRDVPPLEIGEPAPGFALEGLDSGEVSLSALDGKVVVLNFWASWCGPCRLEMPDFQKAWEEHQEQGVVFVGIAVDDTASEASKFAEQVGVTYPLALDTTGDVARAYRIRAVPSTYFIDRDGRLATTLHGLANQGALRIFLRGQTSQEQ